MFDISIFACIEGIKSLESTPEDVVRNLFRLLLCKRQLEILGESHPKRSISKAIEIVRKNKSILYKEYLSNLQRQIMSQVRTITFASSQDTGDEKDRALIFESVLLAKLLKEVDREITQILS